MSAATHEAATPVAPAEAGDGPANANAAGHAAHAEGHEADALTTPSAIAATSLTTTTTPTTTPTTTTTATTTSPPVAASPPPATAGPGAAGAGAGAGTAPPNIVAPSSYLRPHASRAVHRSADVSSLALTAFPVAPGPASKRPMTPLSPVDREQIDGLRAIRAFLKVRTSYDVLPLSYRLIIFDTSLLVKKSLNVLMQCAIVSAPLWDSKTSTFAGLLTTSDYLNVVQYYWQNPDALAQIDKFRLNSLRDIERAIGVMPIETVSIHPLRPLYEACRRMLASRARRIPLVDVDDETQREMVVSVITQYRILKFVCVNVKETQMLRKPLRDLNIGTRKDLATARMDTPVMDVIQMLVRRSISCVPIVDKDGTVLNVFEAVDVIALIKGGDYDNLNLSVGKALEKRQDDFPGIYTCTLNDRLDTIFDTVRKSRVHRLVIIDGANQLKGVLSLSDILDYTLNSPLGDEEEEDG
ncbi:Hypothetical protein R9X50_00205800 [Acrodontium crateriforme]|uniref:CBS domain-containing protein n=1 Tax=Acrodontium crateriforme TaxID=150365 RepID=A0AAQ3RAL2_9PEZI|nr:Hypothetical protein R9X50_00205800 [Acrodontium crateriforme]